jgi:hypothetical protein
LPCKRARSFTAPNFVLQSSAVIRRIYGYHAHAGTGT